jgi:hypothetical protein
MFTGQTGRIFHTLRALVFKPGELALEIEEGRDRGSLRPITLLLNLVAFFFLLSTFTGFLPDAIGSADPSGSIAKDMAEHAAKSGLSVTLFDERLAHRFQTAYTLFLPVIALTYGVSIAVTHPRRKPWIIPIAAGIQYLCFVYLWVAALFIVVRLAGGSTIGSLPVLALEGIGAIIYLTLLNRRLYRERWGLAVAKSIFVLLAGAIVHNLMIIVAVYAALATL